MENRSKFASFKSLMADRIWPAIRPTVSWLLAIATIVGALVIGALLLVAGAIFGDYSSFLLLPYALGVGVLLVYFVPEKSIVWRGLGLWLILSCLISVLLVVCGGDIARPNDLSYLQDDRRLVTIETGTAAFPLWKNVIIARNVRGEVADEVTVVEAPGRLATLDVALTYNVTTAASDLAGGEVRDYRRDIETALKIATIEARFIGTGDEAALAAYGNVLKASMCEAMMAINALSGSCPLELQVSLTYRNATRTVTFNEF